jgi:hypothetical protein
MGYSGHLTVAMVLATRVITLSELQLIPTPVLFYIDISWTPQRVTLHSPWYVAGCEQCRDEIVPALKVRHHLCAPVGQQACDCNMRLAAALLVGVLRQVGVQELTQQGAQPAG